jgi:uncharacterized delta-60 repeat protein
MAASPRARLSAEALEPRETPALVGGTDHSFGAPGGVTTLEGVNGTFFATAVQPDGKIVATGSATVGGTQEYLVARFTPTGAPDPAFGTNGVVTVPLVLNATFGSGSAVAIQANGKIVVALQGNDNAPIYDLLRLNSDGRPDDTFGPGGIHFYGFAQNGTFTTVATGQDGSIIAAGEFGNSHTEMLVARINPVNGNETAASQIIDFGQAVGTSAIAVQPDGHVVVDGFLASNNGGIVLARLPADLSSFRTFTPGLSGSVGGAAVADPVTGAITVAGSVVTGNKFDFVVMRVLPDLSGLDTSLNPTGAFTNTPGTAQYDVGGIAEPVGLVRQPDGKVVLVGTLVGPVGAPLATPSLAAIRVDTDGSLDASFAAPTGGTLFVPGGGGDAAALDNSGRIITAGDVSNGGTATTPAVSAIVGRIGNPVALSVGGAASANASVYAPSGAGYANPPIRITPANVFPGFTGDVRTATADVNGDGFEDTILLTGPGTPGRMAVVSGKDNSVLLSATDPYGDPGGFTSGGFVTAGDIDGSGKADWVITPDIKGGPRVVIFRLDPSAPHGYDVVANFFGIQDASFRDGARAALGDVNGDGILDVFVIAAFNGGPRTALFDGKDVLVATGQGRSPNKLVNDFFGTADGQDEGRGGRGIAVADFNGDGVADYVVTGDTLLGTGNQITIFNGADIAAGKVPGSGAGVLANFTVSGQPGSAGVTVATTDTDDDNKADMVVGSGAGQPSKVRAYLGKNIKPSGEPAFQDLDPYGAATTNGVFVG